MARKSTSKQETKPIPAASGAVTGAGPSAIPIPFVKSSLLVVALAFASLAIQLALHPLFGSAPASINHSKVKLLACFLSVLVPSRLVPSEGTTLLGLASWLGYAPYASYALGKWSTKWRNPVRGATLTEAVFLVPVVTLGALLVRKWNLSSLGFLPGPVSSKVVVAISSFNFLNITESWLWGHLPREGYVNSSGVFIAISVALSLGTAVSSLVVASQPPQAKPGPRYLSFRQLLPLSLPILAVAASLSLPPAYSPPFPYTRGSASSSASLSLAPPATIRVLARTHSITGLVLVGEHVEEGFRFLRADHSLLGGRWFGNKVAPGSRNGLGDSIYSTFVLQEAVRLAERETVPKDEHALFIGLGVGVAAEAIISHGINTTIVEIDPAVYKYAREFFSLPEPDQVYLEDAREWLREQTSPAPQDKFDYVVHDCFSGGGVPEHVFTVEFWEELKVIMKADGVLAVNFAGTLASDPARAILLTLQQSFGKCRAYHDHMEADFDESYTFFNIVFFCTQSTELKFRPANDADYLKSRLRGHVLSALAKREIPLSRILDMEPDLIQEKMEQWILRDASNRLGEWQQGDAVEHWTVMREVLPDVFWETY